MYKWPDKDKDEIVDYSIDWSRFLNGDSISGVTWFVYDADGVKTEFLPAQLVNNLQCLSFTNTLTVATLRVAFGTNNIRYKITCQVETQQGLQFEVSVFLRIKEK